MKQLPRLLAVAAVALAASVASFASLETGKPAPDFTLTDITGKSHSLSSFRGKTVVIEWVNPGCPFVKKHYDKSGNMPATQKAALADGIVWLQINSAAPGKEGDLDAAAHAEWAKRLGAQSTAYFRDQDGKVGHLYDARTTPHMFIVNPEGTLVYQGGIDSIRSANPDDIAKATNYVKAALADIKAGRAVQQATTQPYGCSVKY